MRGNLGYRVPTLQVSLDSAILVSTTVEREDTCRQSPCLPDPSRPRVFQRRPRDPRTGGSPFSEWRPSDRLLTSSGSY